METYKVVAKAGTDVVLETTVQSNSILNVIHSITATLSMIPGVDRLEISPQVPNLLRDAQ